MTRIFTDGAEMGDTLFWTGGSPSVTAVSPASGTYAYTHGGSCYKTIDALGELYYRARVKITTGGTLSNLVIVAFRNSTTTLAYVGLSDLLQWRIFIGSTAVDTATEVLVSGQWYCVEVYYKVDNAAGELTLRVDGNTICTFSGDTQPGAATTVDNLYHTDPSGITTYLDDLALNDTAGGSDDSWCGGGRVTKITPIGNGSTTEWTGSDADAVDNYLLVDEYPKDNDTTYVYEDASATGDLDQYAMSDDYSGTGKTITRIWAECRARKTSVDAATLKIGFDTGASVNTDDVGTLWETYTARCVGAEYTTNPDDAAAWEEADIDALEFVAEVG